VSITWKRLNVKGPPPRGWHSATLIDRKFFVFGGAFRLTGPDGRDMKWCEDMWYFDVDGNFWAQINADLKPKVRDGHSAISLGHTLIILGGWVIEEIHQA
jgi:N-acetylneuraminic acid mutarotase